MTFSLKKTDNKDEKWALVDLLSPKSSQIRIVSRSGTRAFDTFTGLVVQPIEINSMKTFALLIHLKGFEEIIANKIVSEEFCLEVLKHSHCSGHLGIVKMATFLTNNGLFWEGRIKSIKSIKQTCELYKIFKRNNKAINLIQAELPTLEPEHDLAINISQIGLPAECKVLICIQEPEKSN